MNRSAVSLDVLQDLDPFPWSKWHQVQIGLCHLCHSMRFLIPFCLSLLSTYLTALLSTSEAREMCQIFGSPDLLRLSSRHYCGGPSHAVSQLPEQMQPEKTSSQLFSTLQGPTDPLGVWHSNSLDQWNIERFKFWFLMRVQSLHTTTPFLKYTRITQCHHLSWFAASASSKAAKKTNSPVFSALATW